MRYENSKAKFSTWTPFSEVKYVEQLGTGKWSEGSDLRHKRDWWLRQYLKATEGMTGDHIAAGRMKAKELLATNKAL